MYYNFSSLHQYLTKYWSTMYQKYHILVLKKRTPMKISILISDNETLKWKMCFKIHTFIHICEYLLMYTKNEICIGPYFSKTSEHNTIENTSNTHIAMRWDRCMTWSNVTLERNIWSNNFWMDCSPTMVMVFVESFQTYPTTILNKTIKTCVEILHSELKT